MSARWSLLVVLVAWPALATDEVEPLVFEQDQDAAGAAGGELVGTFATAAQTELAWPGEATADQAITVKLEPVLMLTEWLGVGAELPVTWSPSGEGQIGEWRVRTRLVAPAGPSPIILGLDLELCRVPVGADEGWLNVIRPFIGVDLGQLMLTLNPIIGFSLAGPEAFRPELDAELKATFNTNQGFSLGLEYYAALGRFDPLPEQEHLLFLVFNLAPPVGAEESMASPWAISAGLGVSMTPATSQQLFFRTTIARTF